MVGAAAARTRRPVAVEPVNATLSTSGFSTSSMPDVGAVAGDDVEHALGEQAGLVDGPRDLERRQRRLRGRLEHDRVAHRERRRDLPHREDERVVPGDDPGADADRLALDEVPGHVWRIDPGQRLVPGDAERLLGHAAEPLDGERDVDHRRSCAAPRRRSATSSRPQPSDTSWRCSTIWNMICVRCSCDFRRHSPASNERRAAATARRASALVLAGAVRHHLFGGGVDHLVGAAVLGAGPFAVDVLLVGRHLGLDDRCH